MWKDLKLFVTVALMMLAGNLSASGDFVAGSQKIVNISCVEEEAPVVHTALQILTRDWQAVFGVKPQISLSGGDVIVGTWESPLIRQTGVDVSMLQGRHEAFLLTVSPKGRLLIAGSDKRGTAYGIMELSRLIGVSAWEWWADVVPKPRKEFVLPASYKDLQEPSVDFRGIFINDEDWGLTPWSGLTYEPTSVKGQIGPKTHARIFELLLRLRANTFWPAMHECSVPFYFTEGNKEVADKYGIYIGTSHCEPMMRNTNGEWKRDGKGEYDYVNNRENVRTFWEERIKEVAEYDNLYTLGMRGVHDGAMNGAKTVGEQKQVLEQVLKDQRSLLARYVDETVTDISQVFIPYKEVLDVYNAGLEVPDDVTLMWCDDNYGYIRHFPTETEKARKGGNGIYYHISYWGRPHDYLWLCTVQPGLIYQQMAQAYERGIRKMWILNVGDIKPAEYQIELFLDMAWNIGEVKKQGITEHLHRFLEREFGQSVATQTLPVLLEHYRLAYIRKPEFMGATRAEEKDPKYQIIADLPWSETYIRERISAYQQLSDRVEKISSEVSDSRKDAFFQLIKYPVQAAAQMNFKLLEAQLARHGKGDWRKSDMAYDSIVSLTRLYNMGKWNRVMDCSPRRLPVFNRVPHSMSTENMLEEPKILFQWNGADCIEVHPAICEGIGYEEKAVALGQGQQLSFDFECQSAADSLVFEVCLLPNHPVEGEELRFELSLDGGEGIVCSYQTIGRSEEWKVNVLRNQAIRRVVLKPQAIVNHRLRFKALDEGVVLDQIKVYEN